MSSCAVENGAAMYSELPDIVLSFYYLHFHSTLKILAKSVFWHSRASLLTWNNTDSLELLGTNWSGPTPAEIMETMSDWGWILSARLDHQVQNAWALASLVWWSGFSFPFFSNLTHHTGMCAYLYTEYFKMKNTAAYWKMKSNDRNIVSLRALK